MSHVGWMKSTNVRATPERLFSSPEARPTA